MVAALLLKRRVNHMELGMFLTADYAYREPSGKLSIIGIFTNINAPQFPTTHPYMCVVIVLKPESGEYGDTRKLRVQLVDEDGNELGQVTGDISIPATQGGQRPEIPIVLNFLTTVFPRAGTYEFRLYVDKEQKGSLPLALIHLEPPVV
jgi:hypothetical protein